MIKFNSPENLYNWKIKKMKENKCCSQKDRSSLRKEWKPLREWKKINSKNLIIKWHKRRVKIFWKISNLRQRLDITRMKIYYFLSLSKENINWDNSETYDFLKYFFLNQINLIIVIYFLLINLKSLLNLELIDQRKLY